MVLPVRSGPARSGLVRSGLARSGRSGVARSGLARSGPSGSGPSQLCLSVAVVCASGLGGATSRAKLRHAALFATLIWRRAGKEYCGRREAALQMETVTGAEMNSEQFLAGLKADVAEMFSSFRATMTEELKILAEERRLFAEERKLLAKQVLAISARGEGTDLIGLEAPDQSGPPVYATDSISNLTQEKIRLQLEIDAVDWDSLVVRAWN